MDITSSSPSDMDLTNCEVPNESCPNVFVPDVNMNRETAIHKQPVASQVCAAHPTILCSDGYDCHGIKSALEHEVHRAIVSSCRCSEIPTAASTKPPPTGFCTPGACGNSSKMHKSDLSQFELQNQRDLRKLKKNKQLVYFQFLKELRLYSQDKG
ncbi:uncharacterized protein LOC114580662 [Dendrobium catenatum]|uniref:uncharacterized protein LOC114580662 n=1 Tax=Dendrobium catenatum TaxID=906689 RepID=UPI0010A01635|nr:uncharacterized protein LOC114580662 [Dendrobium catenatum]